MDKIYHRQILQHALEARFTPQALEIIIAANLHQDSLSGLVGHPEYHFDDSAFEAGNTYIQKQRAIVVQTLRNHAPIEQAWRAFGRLTHAVQDFYAHSNYVHLWTAALRPDDGRETMSEIEPLEEDLLNDERLRSGRVYWLEVISFIPALRPLAKRLLPADSHAAMNLDTPASDPGFPAAMAAARKRTIYELERILQDLTPEEQARFLGMPQHSSPEPG
ncbi:MAG: hypothetical protein Fur0018_18810 [Anaerolineales bacterium]